MIKCKLLLISLFLFSIIYCSKFIGIIETKTASMDADINLIYPELLEFRFQGSNGGNWDFSAYNNPNGWGLFYYQY